MQSKTIFKFIDDGGHHVIRTVDTEVVTNLIGIKPLSKGLKLNIENARFEIEDFVVEVYNRIQSHAGDLEEIDRGIAGEWNTSIRIYLRSL